nr:hydroxymethylbilane synthase [Chelatococcus sp. HY11]
MPLRVKRKVKSRHKSISDPIQDRQPHRSRSLPKDGPETPLTINVRHPEIPVQIVPIKTVGDTIIDRPLRELDGKALFIKEVEDALLDGRADIAVHCMKDYYPTVPESFNLEVILRRETAFDLILTRDRLGRWRELPLGSVIGTTSQRRVFELKRARPDFIFRPLRGNIDTRLARLCRGDFDAIVLAEAGFHRLGLEHHSVFTLSPEEMLPAVGQGALGIETRAGDLTTLAKIRFLDDGLTHALVSAERAFVRMVGGDCGSAVGAFARFSGTNIILTGFVGDVASMKEIRKTAQGTMDAPEELGIALGAKFASQGAAKIISS